MTRIWFVNWHFQSRITLWCRYKSTNVSMGLCWQMPKFIVWHLWSIYFDHHLPLKPSIGKRRKQSCTLNITSNFNFCDASNVGYEACIYMRSREKCETRVSLCAKSRVTPLKTVPTSRFELCGALLLVQLYRETSNASARVIQKIIFYYDSIVVLRWLNTREHLLKIYA